MATSPIHLAIPTVTTLEFLTSMLATCDTQSDMAVWRQDYLDHSHMLSRDEQLDLVAASSVRMFKIAMGGCGMTDRTAWDRAVAEWTAASMIREAAEKFGPGYRLDQAEMLNQLVLEEKFGKRDDPRVGADGRRAFEEEALRRNAEAHHYWTTYRDPALEAAQRIASTPAPDFDALRLKIDIITEEELQCYNGTENAFELVEADARRLAA